MSETFAALCAVCCCLFPAFVLQSVGFFTPKWASNSTCDSIGLIYSCCAGSDNATCGITNGPHELDQRVLGLQATAFVIMFLAVFGSCFEGCCNNDDEDTGWCGLIGGCCILLYPIAGLLSFIGCMLLVPKYSGSKLGYSFYLCLTSGCLVLLITIGMCCLICRAACKDDDSGTGVTTGSGSGAVQSYSGSGGVLPSSGGGHEIVGHHATIEQRAVVHDPESGSMFMFVRRFNITRIVATMRTGDD